MKNPQIENSSSKVRFMSAKQDSQQGSHRNSRQRMVSPLPLETLPNDKGRIMQNLVQALTRYNGPLAQTTDGDLINDLCVNHGGKNTEFFVESDNKYEKRIGVCASCAVKLATYHFQVHEVTKVENSVVPENRALTALTTVEKLERVYREKEELLKCNKSAAVRSFEQHRKKLDKLFDLIHAVVDKKRAFFEEALREKYQLAKHKLQNKFFRIQQSKQTLEQVRIGLTDTDIFHGVEDSKALDESMRLFHNIFHESQMLFESIKFVPFRPFDDFSIKEIVDKIELALTIDGPTKIGHVDEPDTYKDEYPQTIPEEAEGNCQDTVNISSSFEVADLKTESKCSPEISPSEIQILDEGAILAGESTGFFDADYEPAPKKCGAE